MHNIIIGIVIGLALMLAYNYYKEWRMKSNTPPDSVRVAGSSGLFSIDVALHQTQEIKPNGERSNYFTQSKFPLDPGTAFIGMVHNNTMLPLTLKIEPILS